MEPITLLQPPTRWQSTCCLLFEPSDPVDLLWWWPDREASVVVTERVSLLVVWLILTLSKAELMANNQTYLS